MLPVAPPVRISVFDQSPGDCYTGIKSSLSHCPSMSVQKITLIRYSVGIIKGQTNQQTDIYIHVLVDSNVCIVILKTIINFLHWLSLFKSSFRFLPHQLNLGFQV